MKLTGVKALTILVILLWPMAWACTADEWVEPDPEEKFCPCDRGECSPIACTYELSMHANCGDEVVEAEVLIDGHLEEESMFFGVPYEPCMKTNPGESSTVIVRGGVWIWGPLIKTCGVTGSKVHTLVFECAESPAQ